MLGGTVARGGFSRQSLPSVRPEETTARRVLLNRLYMYTWLTRVFVISSLFNF